MKIAAVQHVIDWENAPATIGRVEPMVAKAAAEGARLILLTEMFGPGFSMAAERIAEADDGPSTTFLIAAAGRHDAWIGGSVPLRGATPRPRNTFVLAAPDGAVHRYAKMHPFSYAGEHEHYDAGTDVITVTIDGLRVTPFVCYDLRFADAFWNAAAATDLYTVVANWPSPRRAHWTALLRARAIENQAYVAGVNRVGSGGGLDYAGDSAIFNPMGEVLAEAGANEAILVADVDADLVESTRQRFPFIADR